MNETDPDSIARPWREAARQGLSLHFVGEQGLLLDPMRQRLYALNASAAVVWGLLEDGSTPAEVSGFLSERFGLSPDAAASYLNDVLHQNEALRGDAGTQLPIGTPARAAAPALRSHRSRAATIETYGLLDSTFRFHYGSRLLFEAIDPLLRHGAMPDGVGAAEAIDVDVVQQDDGGVLVAAAGKPIGSSATIEEAAVAVRACLTELAVDGSRGLCAIHAGALCRDGAALLLPGEAGHGKSTLSAGLAARGFDMLSDDTTLLAGEPTLVRCLPAGLCIKRGAYAVLAPHFPRLSSLREWRRPDGKHARYLMPGDDLGWASPQTALAVRWIVFPRYHPDRGTALVPMPRHEALARLLRGVYFLSGTLDEANLDRLISWIERIDCFELPLASLDEATALIDGLCQREDR